MFIKVLFLSLVPLDECDLHEKDFRWQRSIGNKLTFGAYMDYCDTDLKPSWYRFSTKAGEDMPTTCPPINSCGICTYKCIFASILSNIILKNLLC